MEPDGPALIHVSSQIRDNLLGTGISAVGGPVDPAREPGWRIRSILLGVLLVLALVAALASAPIQARARLSATTQALTGWLWPTRWIWPLAVVLTLAVLSIPAVHRQWPRAARRIMPAIGIFAGLVGLASLATMRRPIVGLMVLGAVVAIGLIAMWVLVVPRRLAPPVPQEELRDFNDDRARLEMIDARTKLRNDVRTTALQAVAGLAVLAGAVLAFQQFTEDRRQAADTHELTIQAQASQRFTQAISQLGDEKRAETRIGGVYGLEQIAQQAPYNRLAVTEVLVAYLHRRGPRLKDPQPRKGVIEILRTRAPDLQAALTVLGRRNPQPDDPKLDLRALSLHGADLRNANLNGADLHGSDLTEAALNGAHLNGANLSGAQLAIADFRGAELRGANLLEADLSGAILRGMDLRGADLSHSTLPGVITGVDLSDANLSNMDLSQVGFHGVRLRGADLFNADLHGNDLRSMDLRDAKFAGADLHGAHLGVADLRDADLSNADLRGADLSRADLRGTDLSRAYLSGADLRGATTD